MAGCGGQPPRRLPRRRPVAFRSAVVSSTVALLALCLTAGCGRDETSSADVGAFAGGIGSTGSTGVAGVGSVPGGPERSTPAAGGTTPAPPPTTRPATATTVAGVGTSTSGPVCAPADPTLTAAGPVWAPPALGSMLDARLADPRFAGVQLSASVWVQGFGEVAAVNPSTPLTPASNQKLLTAVGVLSTLDPWSTLSTTVLATGSIADGVLQGDLVVVGGGDPTLTRQGPNSLDALAVQVAGAGVQRVAGSVVADASRHPAQPDPPGWGAGLRGPLRALSVDQNTWNADAAYLADPVVGNGVAFLDALAARGVAVDGGVVAGAAPSGARPLAVVRSEPIWRLVTDMVGRSDNEHAELLLREVGRAGAGQATTAAGLAVSDRAAAALCAPLDGASVDGSGLSPGNRHSARSLRLLLQAGLAAPIGEVLSGSLSVGGQWGTLLPRFVGTPAEGNVRGKSGSLAQAVSLTGTLRTASGRLVAFSVVAEGPGAAEALAAIDDLVVALASDAS